MGLSQMFQSFKANSGDYLEDLAKSSIPAVDHSYLGQAPRKVLGRFICIA